MSNDQAKIDRAWALMEQIKVGLFVTHDGHGDHLRARPVHAHPISAECAIYFLTDAQSGKTHEIDGDQHVCIAFSDVGKHKYVSVTGTAAVLDDRAKIERLWTRSDKAFWAAPDDPSIRLIRIDPSIAEYWDSFGAIVTAVKIAASSVTGARLALSENETVELTNRRAR
jgi:general stress protein 26